MSTKTLERVKQICENSQSEAFASYSSITELLDTQNVKGEDIALVMMAYNTTMGLIADAMDRLIAAEK